MTGAQKPLACMAQEDEGAQAHRSTRVLPTRKTTVPKLVVFAAFILLAVNLRPALAGVGPVIDQIGRSYGLTGSEMALLTTLPVLCFGLLAPTAPRLVRRLGLNGAVVLALVAVTAGLVVRILPGPSLLFTGTVALGCGIAVANVLMPAIVKREFSTKVGPATGAYATAINLSAEASAAVAAPLSGVGGWKASLGVWTIPAVLALAVWGGAILRARERPSAAHSAPAWHLLRDRKARALVGFTASQSVIYYSVLAWYPAVYVSHGYSAHAAGWLLSVVNITSAPVALVVPVLAGRSRSQVPHVVIIALCAAAGITGLLLMPETAALLWAVLIGIGQGGAFPLALTMFVLRTRNASETASMSTIAQCLAYLVAACGPFVIGLLHDHTGSWRPGVAVLLACAAVELVSGVRAGRPGAIGPPQAQPASHQLKEN